MLGSRIFFQLKLPFSRKLPFLQMCLLISHFEACFCEKASVTIFLLPKYPWKQRFGEVGDSSEN